MEVSMTEIYFFVLVHRQKFIRSIKIELRLWNWREMLELYPGETTTNWVLLKVQLLDKHVELQWWKYLVAKLIIAGIFWKRKIYAKGLFSKTEHFLYVT